MSLKRLRIAKQIFNFSRKTLTKKHALELQHWIGQSDAHRLKFNELTDETTLLGKLEQFQSVNREQAWQKLIAKIDFACIVCKDNGNNIILAECKSRIDTPAPLIETDITCYIK